MNEHPKFLSLSWSSCSWILAREWSAWLELLEFRSDPSSFRIFSNSVVFSSSVSLISSNWRFSFWSLLYCSDLSKIKFIGNWTYVKSSSSSSNISLFCSSSCLIFCILTCSLPLLKSLLKNAFDPSVLFFIILNLPKLFFGV